MIAEFLTWASMSTLGCPQLKVAFCGLCNWDATTLPALAPPSNKTSSPSCNSPKRGPHYFKM